MANWGFVVGIDRYQQGSQLDDLAGAVADAAEFAEWLLDPQGGNVAPANLYFWSHGQPDKPGPALTQYLAAPTPWPHGVPSTTEAPTAGLINMAIDKVASNARLAGADRLYIFFAGHGFQTQAKDYVEVSQPCFVAGDYHPDMAAMGLVPCDDMLRMLMSQGPREIVFFLDACRVDAARRVARPAAPWNIRANTGVHVRRAVGRAAQPLELAFEVPIGTPTRGAFSQLLIEGLRQHRVGGVLSVQALDNYIMQAMPALIAPHSQYPIIEEIPRPYAMVLAQGHPIGPQPVIRIDFAPLHAGQDFVIIGGPANVRIMIQATADAFVQRFAPGNYVLETAAGDEMAAFNHSGPGETHVST